MPLYYFHLVGDRAIEDDEGTDLADDLCALRYAGEVAFEMARNQARPENRSLRAVNSKGALVGTVSLADLRLRWRHLHSR